MSDRYWRNALAGASKIFMLSAAASIVMWTGAALADVFYIDATTLNTVAVNGQTDWFTGTDQGTPSTGGNSQLKWKFRSDQGNSGIFEATQSGTQTNANAPLLMTTITDAPVGTYDVYAFYRSQTSNPDNWNIRAGLTETELNLFDRTGDLGTPGLRVFNDTTPLVTFAGGTQPAEDTGQPLYYAVIGQATVTDGILSVYIDDLPTAGMTLPPGSGILNFRTWYDGIGYFVPGVIPIIDSAMTGLHTTPSTWTNNQAPASGNEYRVLSGHIVTVDSAFQGNKLTATSGGTVKFSASGTDVRSLVIEPGSNITETVSGNFYLGDISASTLGILNLQRDVSFDIDSGTEFGLDMKVIGSGNIDFNAGSNATLYIAGSVDSSGAIRFNGTSGGQVMLLEKEGFNELEMNSPGATLVYSPGANLDTSVKLTFTQPGTIQNTSMTNRLQGAIEFNVNAAVTVDLTSVFGATERRWLTSGKLQGSAPLTVNGMISAPVGVDYNEFEIGSQGTTENEPTNLLTSPYSGTVTLNDYVNMEVRHHMPNASFVVNNHAILEMGHMKRVAANSIRMGEIEVKSGGTLEIGMEKSAGPTDGHFAYHLTLDNTGGKSGGLILRDGAQLNMQINGDPTETTLFDRITAAGNIELNGTLRMYVNPEACIGNTTCLANMSYDDGDFTPYVPNAGDTWDIIATTGGASPPGDYDNSGTVDNLDHAEWVKYFGTADTTVDGNGNGIVDAADYVIWRKNFGATGGGGGIISGQFDNIVDDLDGFHFVATYLPNLVRLTLVAGESGSGGAVPEPSALVLAGLMLSAAGTKRRCRG